MKMIPFSISILLVVTACGSVETTRYAQPGDAIGPGSTFAAQDVKRYVVVNGTRSLRDQTFQITVSDDGQSVVIQQNHKTFTLVDDGTGTFRGDNAVFFLEETGSSVVNTGYFSESTSGYFNAGEVVFGYLTDPNQIAGRSGSAAYAGTTYLSARTPSQDGFATGDVTLNANFSTSTVTGLMAITDDGGAGDLFIPTSTITINPGNISNINGNAFSGALDISLGATPDTITFDDSGLTGNFYGVNAAAVGATYWATGTFNGEALFIGGALASDN